MFFSPLLRWLKAMSQSCRASAAAPNRKYRPRFEVLEDRVMPTFVINNVATVTPLSLARTLVGPGVSVSNIKYTGANVAGGSFTDSQKTVGFGSGVILSSGSAKGVAGPNTSSSFTASNGTPSDPDLDAIIAPTGGNDANVLEFDWVPNGNIVVFSYVFGSEEYPEFAPPNTSPFNDVFALFLNGKNVTFLPGTRIPVSINNVNAVTNQKFYVDNDVQPVGPFDTQMDGFTKVLTAVLIVKAGTTNHIKLAIEDASDTAFDSWVLIKTGSLAAAPVRTYAPLRYTYNPWTGLYSGYFTVTNFTQVNLPGPLFLIFSKLPQGVTVAGASKSPSGLSYLRFPSGLKAGDSLRVLVKLRNPLNKPLGTFFVHFPLELTNILT